MLMDFTELKAESFDRLVKFFEENVAIKPYFNAISTECKKNECYSLSTIMILTIEKLLDEIHRSK